MKLSIRQKMALIVVIGILISAVTLSIYELVQRKVLANEIGNLQKIIDTERHTQISGTDTGQDQSMV
jgi:hypothetical protein